MPSRRSLLTASLATLPLLCSTRRTDATGNGTDNELTPREKDAGWRLLFDGNTLDGWMTSSSTPSKRPVEDHCLNQHLAGGYMLVHKETRENFVFSCDFKIS